MYIRSGMFSFGLTNFLSLSDRTSDMLKKFSTSLTFSKYIYKCSIKKYTFLCVKLLSLIVHVHVYCETLSIHVHVHDALVSFPLSRGVVPYLFKIHGSKGVEEASTVYETSKNCPPPLFPSYFI